MKKNNKAGTIYISVLLVFVLLIGIFIPFIVHFNLVDNRVYHFVIFGFSLFAGLTTLLIVIAEFISLRIDRTATKNTFYVAFFIFLSLLTSKDFVYFLSLLAPNIYTDLEIVVKYVLPIIFTISYSLVLYFLYKFFEEDYGVKKYSLKILIGLTLLTAINSLFIILNIEAGIIITTMVQGSLLIVISTYYLFNAKNNDKVTAVLSTFIGISLSLIFFLNAYQIRGPQIFFYLSISGAFISIYLNFFINKTNIVYQYDDEQKERKADKVMRVKCFQCFDCFIDDKIITFPSKKCKEFFALLVVLNGSSLTMDKAITYLYPDKDIEKAKISYRDIIWRLRKLFETLSFHGVIFRRGETVLLPNHIKCDYIDVINKKEKYYGSPLMPEYDWSIEFENILENQQY